MSDHATGGNAAGPIFTAQFAGLDRRRVPVILDMVEGNCGALYGRIPGMRRKRFHDVSYRRIVVIGGQSNAARIDDHLSVGKANDAGDVGVATQDDGLVNAVEQV